MLGGGREKREMILDLCIETGVNTVTYSVSQDNFMSQKFSCFPGG